MTVSVLIVDDSGFFRRRLSEMINACPGLEVVGVATNGREGVEKARSLKPDVITMDYEMPVMDGIAAVREIMATNPTPILMFSSLTYEGARVTLESLEAGAVDYLSKSFEDIARNSEELKQKLAERLTTVARSRARAIRPAAFQAHSTQAAHNFSHTAPSSAAAPPIRPAPRRPVRSKPYRLVAIGTSTGGPVALQNVLTQLPASFPKPLLLIQHMPGTFTKAFADRLNAQCKIRVKEAEDGDQLKPGLALLAPGGKQLMVTRGDRVKILPGDERLNYKPSVDVTFASAANVYGGDVLAVVLTGMGADGCEGAKILKQQGATIWAQDEATSVIYGMPMAVARAGITDEILPLQEVGARLNEAVKA